MLAEVEGRASCLGDLVRGLAFRITLACPLGRMAAEDWCLLASAPVSDSGVVGSFPSFRSREEEESPAGVELYRGQDATDVVVLRLSLLRIGVVPYSALDLSGSSDPFTRDTDDSLSAAE